MVSGTDTFEMGGMAWRVCVVPPYSPELTDRTGARTVATTDPESHRVCLSSVLEGPFLLRVLIHELGHCAMVSFGLLDEIAGWARPGHRIEAEEWCCNLLADYGMRIFEAAFEVLGYDAWKAIPGELGRLAA